ncbi:hypothetical protein CTC_01456 [Clostridium tetani E88]|uniref:Uncharacterized protein n=1 Tax=Clostridium tetani (strain Massachusetts / E88) TaxID=212717 RepID=Q894S8_CLOTE|nr:hypothetical protein CTC_01456 [Clostridium tetani E88]
MLLFNLIQIKYILLQQYLNTTLVIVQRVFRINLGRQTSFKYNSCYCSTDVLTTIMNAYKNLNTTLVIVQLLILLLSYAHIYLFKYNSCYCSTSYKINTKMWI